MSHRDFAIVGSWSGRTIASFSPLRDGRGGIISLRKFLHFGFGGGGASSGTFRIGNRCSGIDMMTTKMVKSTQTATMWTQ